MRFGKKRATKRQRSNGSHAPVGGGRPVKVTQHNFREVVLEAGDRPVLVDFWAPWCGPCRMVAPVLDELASELGDQVTIAKVNVDEEQGLAAAFGIRSIPTLVLLRGGDVADVMIGAQPKARIRKALERQL